MNRRDALFSLGKIAALVVAPAVAAKELTGFPKETQLNADSLPKAARLGGAQVLTDPTDRATLAAVFNRLIPADQYGPSAVEAGCLEFIDNQLAGDYGNGKALYLDKPLNPKNEAAIMGAPQFLATPKERYLTGLKALEAYARQQHGKAFAELGDDAIDQLLGGLEAGTVSLGNEVDGQAFFELMLQNVREGYLADPLYGGNKGMAGWKMIGFPGARYDYRPYIDRRGEDLQLIPVSLVPED